MASIARVARRGHVTVTIHEVIFHRGHCRIALLQDRSLSIQSTSDAGTGPSDAAPARTDAALTPAIDAATAGADASPQRAPTRSSGGCSVWGAGSVAGGAAWLVGLGLLVKRRRSRRA